MVGVVWSNIVSSAFIAKSELSSWLLQLLDVPVSPSQSQSSRLLQLKFCCANEEKAPTKTSAKMVKNRLIFCIQKMRENCEMIDVYKAAFLCI